MSEIVCTSPSHYIYDDCDRDCLFQGDVIAKSEEIVALLNDLHKSFALHPNIKQFLVLTQSCDLVRRNGSPPSARYITLCAVRPVEDAILAEAKKNQQWWQEPTRVIDSKVFNQLVLFTENLLDNNRKNYFYLHEDVACQISTRCCAFLSQSIALNANLLETFQEYKIAQLKESFRAKLGWLVGDMYSRVGTQEWDEHYGKNNIRKEASALLQGTFRNLPTEQIKKGLEELRSKKDLNSYSPHEILKHIVDTKGFSRQRRYNDRIDDLFGKIKVIDPIYGGLIQALKKDQQLLIDLTVVLEKASEKGSDLETLRDETLAGFEKSLRLILNDTKFPNRNRLVERIANRFKEDTLMKNILR